MGWLIHKAFGALANPPPGQTLPTLCRSLPHGSLTPGGGRPVAAYATRAQPNWPSQPSNAPGASAASSRRKSTSSSDPQPDAPKSGPWQERQGAASSWPAQPRPASPAQQDQPAGQGQGQGQGQARRPGLPGRAQSPQQSAGAAPPAPAGGQPGVGAAPGPPAAPAAGQPSRSQLLDQARSRPGFLSGPTSGAAGKPAGLQQQQQQQQQQHVPYAPYPSSAAQSQAAAATAAAGAGVATPAPPHQQHSLQHQLQQPSALLQLTPDASPPATLPLAAPVPAAPPQPGPWLPPLQPDDQQQAAPGAAGLRGSSKVYQSSFKPLPLTAEALQFFAQRGISEHVLQRNAVCMELAYNPATKQQEQVIAFPYYRQGELVNVKYRKLPKQFWTRPGGRKLLYGYDDVWPGPEPGSSPVMDPVTGLPSNHTIVIVEGEMDKLALNQAGFWNVVSVPFGAPSKAGKGAPVFEDFDPLRDRNFSYIWDCRELFEGCSRVIIATDNDGPGFALREELARRLGRERCWVVNWPNNFDDLQRLREAVAYRAQAWEQAHAQQQLEGQLQGLGPALEPTAAEQQQQQQQQGGPVELQQQPAELQLQQGQQQLQAGMHSQQEDSSSSSALDPGTLDAALQLLQAVSSADGTAAATAAGPAAAAPEVDTGKRKDANEVLLREGPLALQQLLLGASPFPVKGLYRFKDFESEILEYHDMADPYSQGASTGWPELDPFYKVAMGELTIVTGVPNSGKSEWLDALLVNLSSRHGWSFALCSMEKRPKDHARQLLEKHVGKPFFTLAYAGEKVRMTPDELAAGMQWISARFFPILKETGPGKEGSGTAPTAEGASSNEAAVELATIDWVLDKARVAVLRYGIRGLVIDPYNELDHKRPPRVSETEYVSGMLSKVKRFAQNYDCHVWFVAHPRVLRDWRGEPPNLYDISGSAHFINKADNGIVVHRPWSKQQQQQQQQRGKRGAGQEAEAGSGQGGQQEVPENAVRILVRKVRNKSVGRVGEAMLLYDRATGRYHGPGDAAKMQQHAPSGPRQQQAFQQQQQQQQQVGPPAGARGMHTALLAPGAIQGVNAAAAAPAVPDELDWQGLPVPGPVDDIFDAEEQVSAQLAEAGLVRLAQQLNVDLHQVEDYSKPRLQEAVDHDDFMYDPGV